MTALSSRSHNRLLWAGIMGLLLTSSNAIAVDSKTSAFLNTPQWSEVRILSAKGPLIIAALDLNLEQPSNVLVQFTSELVVEQTDGCPCVVSASASMDKGEERMVKSADVSSKALRQIDAFDHDRVSLDGSTVFQAAPGKHTFQVTFLEQQGKSDEVLIHLPNIQVMALPQ